MTAGEKGERNMLVRAKDVQCGMKVRLLTKFEVVVATERDKGKIAIQTEDINNHQITRRTFEENEFITQE